MTQPQIALKACPKGCQTAAPEMTEYAGEADGFYVLCPVCHMRGPLGWSKEIALEYWQQMPRSSPQVAPGLRDAWNAFEEKAIASNGYFDLYANRWPEYDVLRDAIAAAKIQPDTGLRDFAEWLWKLQADYLTAGAYQERETVLYVTDELLKRIGITETDVVADIAAAQGGQVDLFDVPPAVPGLRDSITRAIHEYMRSHGHIYATDTEPLAREIAAVVAISVSENRDRYLARHPTAVPSAPGGAERVKAAFAEVASIVDDRFQHNSRFPWPSFEELRDAIAALGQPQGADSLTDTTRLEK